MAPEYIIHKQFSVKSDVFSFGVLVLEIVSGQGINSFRIEENLKHLPSYVSKIILGKFPFPPTLTTINAHARWIFSLLCIHSNYVLQAWRSWREGTASNIIDSRMRSGSTIAIIKIIHIGLLCVQENAADRPTMATVVAMLNNSSNTLPVPSQPAFFMYSNIESNISPDQSFQASRNDLSVTDQYPR